MIFAKKSLGQNFLKNKDIIQEIVKVAKITETDTVLEIGPGQGVLTEALLKTGATVIAVEKDDRLIDILNEKFTEYVTKGLFKLIHDDILIFEPSQHNLEAGKYKLVANIPYYITGQILRQFLDGECPPSLMVLMLQKEVAERIVTRNTKESILSISVKVYGKPKYIRTVARGNFQPIPNVDSAILLIDDISKNFFTEIPAKLFFEIIKQGFGKKRKMLKGNLEINEEILIKSNISPKARAEELTLEQWGDLIKQMQIANKETT